MKPRTQIVISLATVALLVIGIFALMNSASSTLIAVQTKFTPHQLDLENMGTVTAQIKLEREGKSVVDEIDAGTVVLEGGIPPTFTEVVYLPNGNPTAFIAKFDGDAVKGYVIRKIIHMGITRPKLWNKVNVHLTVSGRLDDNTAWEGTGSVMVYFSDVVAPPPPPPP